jgi:hypothetical protein
MQTKGINTDEQIRKFRTNKLTEQQEQECYLKVMLISCFCYGGYERDSYSFNQYLKPYINSLGQKVFDEVYKEQLTFLQKTYRVVKDTYTDHEGCTYNSLEEIK